MTRLTSDEHLTKSFERMALAKKRKRALLINGDPDADGISGTTILTTGLRQLDLKPRYAFPIRSREGHGLQLRIIQEAKEKAQH